MFHTVAIQITKQPATDPLEEPAQTKQTTLMKCRTLIFFGFIRNMQINMCMIGMNLNMMGMGMDTSIMGMGMNPNIMGSSQPVDLEEVIRETQPVPTQEPPTEDAGASQPKKQPHKNKAPEEPRAPKSNVHWPVEEEFQLARAFLSSSEDPIIGNHQDRSVFWNRVREDFHKLVGLGVFLGKPIQRSLERDANSTSHVSNASKENMDCHDYAIFLFIFLFFMVFVIFYELVSFIYMLLFLISLNKKIEI